MIGAESLPVKNYHICSNTMYLFIYLVNIHLSAYQLIMHNISGTDIMRHEIVNCTSNSPQMLMRFPASPDVGVTLSMARRVGNQITVALIILGLQFEPACGLPVTAQRSLAEDETAAFRGRITMVLE